MTVAKASDRTGWHFLNSQGLELYKKKHLNSILIHSI